jgi:phage FluMu gp28-like protein
MMAGSAVLERTYVRPWLADYQLDALFCPERYALVEATTKSGKTVGAMAWLVEQALVHGKAARNYWWVAPILAQSRIVFRRTKRGLPQGEYKTNETELTITLPNDAVLWFKSAEDPDGLYGEDVHAAVIDEASRVKEESWHAVRSTLTATRGPVRLIGNVKGRKNWAYRLARRAEGGDPGMHYAKITADDAVRAGILERDEVEDARSLLPEGVFKQLYLAEPSDDEGNPFGVQAIRACIAPMSDADPVAWGIDLAKSTDWTVAVGLDAARRVCRLERFQRSWQDTIRVLRDLVGATPALVDSTGVGDPVLEALQQTSRNYEGFKFSQSSKQQLMEGLAVAIQQGQVSYPDGVVVRELEQFEYVYTRTGVHYAAPDGAHDDCVCALALAVEKTGRPVRRLQAL